MNQRKTVSEFAPAKINLFLEITGKRPDGYHSLVSVMTTASLGDDLTISLTEGEDIRLTGSGMNLTEDNLCLAAARLFRDQVGLTGGVEIHLSKQIPLAAGLGGGSADGAAVLRGLNRLAGNPLSLGELARMGLALGADVPFCVLGGTALAEGVGEILTPLPEMPPCRIEIVKQGEKQSTGHRYRLLDEIENREIRSPEKMMDALRRGSLEGICRELYNAFSLIGDGGFCRRAVADMMARGAVGAGMSGSGPAVFGIFPPEITERI